MKLLVVFLEIRRPASITRVSLFPGDQLDALGFRCRSKFWVVQHSVRSDKRKFIMALVREAEGVKYSSEFRTVHVITNELVGNRTTFDGQGSLRSVSNSR